MKRLSIGTILLLALVGFGLQPTRGRAVAVNLAALRSFPLALGEFHSVSDNNAELAGGLQVTDGSEGLERYYADATGRKFYVYVAPQTIGQHVPIMCYRYAGFSTISETQESFVDQPELRFNRMVAREDRGSVVSDCLYFWKTADGVFVPRPNHSLGMIAIRWSNHQQGVLVKVCAEAQNAQDAATKKELERLLRDTYREVAGLYPAVFPNSTK